MVSTKEHSVFSCGSCGHASPRWFGRCPSCGDWSSASAAAPKGALETLDVVALTDSLTGDEGRMPTDIGEVDRVLGGGLVRGEAILLAGEPGIGKSTLVLQMVASLVRAGRSCLVITGEESLAQVAGRAVRMGLDAAKLRASSSSSVEAIVQAATAEKPHVLIVDSIQAMQSAVRDGDAGSPSAVRDCATDLVRFAKTSGTAVVMTGHVTKEGVAAGPKALEHVVDAVLTIEGERTGPLRILRALKNRFGSCDETGVFLMSETGLREVSDPSALLLADRKPGVEGSVVFPTLEGNRALLVEIQALVAKTDFPQPRRVAIGVDTRRLAMHTGIVAKTCGLTHLHADVFVAAAGGIEVREPAADLAVCVAMASSLERFAIPSDLVAIGEVGLASEIRRVPGMERRLREAARLGFTRALAPRGVERIPEGIEVVTVEELRAALDYCRVAKAEPDGDVLVSGVVP